MLADHLLRYRAIGGAVSGQEKSLSRERRERDGERRFSAFVLAEIEADILRDAMPVEQQQRALLRRVGDLLAASAPRPAAMLTGC